MTIELVKEYSKTGSISYHVAVDGKYVAGTICFELEAAMEHYNSVKENITKERTVVLIKEEI